MDLIRVYECLCDVTRLRLLNVLRQGPLCVCHFQAVLRAPQVQISKHLAYLRQRGLVECERRGNWMVYRLPATRSPVLAANLACLQDCVGERPVFRRDLERLARLAPVIGLAHRRHRTAKSRADSPACRCGVATSRSRQSPVKQ